MADVWTDEDLDNLRKEAMQSDDPGMAKEIIKLIDSYKDLRDAEKGYEEDASAYD